jgi:hypothetical protein
MLGGFSNFEVDRRVTARMSQILPEIAQSPGQPGVSAPRGHRRLHRSGS